VDARLQKLAVRYPSKRTPSATLAASAQASAALPMRSVIQTTMDFAQQNLDRLVCCGAVHECSIGRWAQ
jgi:hypothetical protein